MQQSDPSADGLGTKEGSVVGVVSQDVTQGNVQYYSQGPQGGMLGGQQPVMMMSYMGHPMVRLDKEKCLTLFCVFNKHPRAASSIVTL